MTIKAIKCKKCGDIIYSRCRHDFHWCSCNNIAIDGGFDYIKISFRESDSYESLQIDIDATETELYNDWSKNKNKYGKIRSKTEDFSV